MDEDEDGMESERSGGAEMRDVEVEVEVGTYLPK